MVLGLPRSGRPLHGADGRGDAGEFSYDSWEAQQGLTCMSCHSIAEIKDPRGNGSYVIEEAEAVSVRVLEEQDARRRSTGS